MTLAEATRQVRALFEGYGLTSRGLNEHGLGGAALGEAEVYFEFLKEPGALKCSALVYKFHDPPRPEILKSFQQETLLADSGGGRLDYEPESKGVYLTRAFDQPLPDPDFRDTVRRLLDASVAWREVHIPQLAARGNQTRN